METATEHCDRCGSVVYPFSRGTAACDSFSYCIKCAEELDSDYLSKNICSICTRLLGNDEIKFVMPSRLYSNYFFDKLPLEHRLMCVHCYRRVEKLNIIRQPLIKIGQIRLRLKKGIARRSIVRARSRNT